VKLEPGGKMMRKWIHILGLLSALGFSSQNLYANYDYGRDCDDCCQGSNQGHFVLGGDWLYWKTEQTKLNYGTAFTLDVTGTEVRSREKVLKPQFHYESGYRFFVDYIPCGLGRTYHL
jgi:hypothetical protein